MRVFRIRLLLCYVRHMANNTYSQRVSRSVKNRAYLAGVTHKQIAEAIGRSANPTSQRMNGHAEFSLSELEVIAPLLGATPEELTSPAPASE